MPLIPIDFDEVPNEILPVKAGIYTVVVDGDDNAPKVGPTKDGKSEKLVVAMTITNPGGEEDGRKLFAHLSMKYPTGIKRLFMSAGLNPGSEGVNTSDLIGKALTVRVKAGTYRDDETGEVRETSRVDDFLVESESAV